MQRPAEPRTSQGYIVDVVPLLRWPGNRCHAQIDDAPTGLSISSATANRLEGVLVAESMADSLSVIGSLNVTWVGECRRCLEPTEGVTPIDVQEIYERDPTEGETYTLPKDRLDLEPMVRELVLLGLPLAPLCGAECAGPAPGEFPATVESETDEEPRIDPRWAALDQVVFDAPEEPSE